MIKLNSISFLFFSPARKGVLDKIKIHHSQVNFQEQILEEGTEEQCRYIFPSLAPILHRYVAVVYGFQLLVDLAPRTPTSEINFKTLLTTDGRVDEHIFAYFVININSIWFFNFFIN